jgi:hypothetical protein
MTQEKKFFPINTSTACQLKWSWSTVQLSQGITSSCYRSSMSELTPENFLNFHNTPLKLEHRKMMLNGEWPGQSDRWGCHYCKEIEDAGGVSDRMWHLNSANMYPTELDADPTAIEVKPVVVELFLNNTCQLSCVYCSPKLSSSINAENKKFKNYTLENYNFESLQPNAEQHYENLLPAFRSWFETDFKNLRRLNILGGEPFFQKEFSVILDYIDNNPNPNCELNIVSNLMMPRPLLESYIIRIKNLLARRKIKNLQLLASIDAWGPQEEYVRWGLNLEHWESNFRYLLSEPWIKLGFNQVFSPLTIKTAPELMHKLQEFRQIRHVSIYSGTISPGPSYFIPNIFGAGVFEEDFKRIVNAMPIDTEEDTVIKNYIEGIGKAISTHQRDLQEIKKMLLFLDEKDRRRGTNWKTLFPWLMEFEHMVKSVELKNVV